MKRKSIYVETSLFSYLTSKPSRDLITAARQQISLVWWEENRKHYDLFISNVVVAEASKGDELGIQDRLDMLKLLPRLQVREECVVLAEKLINDTPLPRHANNDALHMAIASYHGVDFLLTWDFRHLANALLIPRMRVLIETQGYAFPHICTPEELMEKYDEERE